MKAGQRPRSLLLVCVILLTATAVFAGERGPIDEPKNDVPYRTAGTTARFAAGALGAFLAHEAGHVAANLFVGNRPHITGFLSGGIIPFFAVEPRVYCDRHRCVTDAGRSFSGGRRAKYNIVTAGFTMQHLGSELILLDEPRIRHQVAPFRKGWLAFNILLSTGYAVANLTGLEDGHGDAGGAEYVSHLPKYVFASLLLIPALTDTVRYYRPRATWALWASRAGKTGMIGVGFAI